MSSAEVTDAAAVRRERALATGLGVLLLVFSSTLLSFPAVWSSARSHGFVAAAFGGWLLWRDRRQLEPATPPSPFTVWLPLLSLLWLVGFVLNLQVVHQSAVVAILLVWLLALSGPRARPVLAGVAVTWSLALPVWELLVPLLQWMTVVANRALLGLTSIQATFDGDLITIAAGTFLVADSCAGLNFLMSGLTLGTMYAMLFVRHWRRRAAVIGVAALVSIVANWVRVFGLVLIGDFTAMQSPLMREHGTYGWLVFLAALPVFFVVARRLEGDAHGPAGAALPAPVESRAVPESQGPSIPMAVARATAVAIVGPLCFALVSLLPDDPDAPASAPGVEAPSPWTRDAGPAEARPWQASYRGASEHRIEHWRNGAADVQVERVIYQRQRQGAELVANDNRLAPDSTLLGERLIGPLDSQSRIVREAGVRTADGVRLVWYWYRVAGTSTASPPRAKLLELIAFIRRSPPSEAVVVSTPCSSADCREARRRLFHFVAARDASAS